MKFFEEIAKKAFIEVMSYELSKTCDKDLNTIHLTTDPGGIQNNRPGVYIIRHMGNGFCVSGQTKNLKKRFNQYTSRSTNIYSEKNKINKNFYIAVQKALKKIKFIVNYFNDL
jgi:hypothetical protein